MSDLLRFIFSTQEPFKNTRRVESLYDDLNRFKEFEPVAYRANVDAWRNALVAASKEGLIPPASSTDQKSKFIMCTSDQLVKALESRTFGVPQSLAVVLADAAHRRDIITLSEFQKATSNIHYRSWLPSVPSLGDMLWWSWNQLGFSNNGNSPFSLPKAEWIVPANLEESAQQFLKLIKDPSDSQSSKVHTITTLKAALSDQLPLSDFDLHLLLKYLSRDKPNLTYDTSLSRYSEPIIKIGYPLAPINSEDVAIVSLKSTLVNLESKITPLETQVTDLEKTARKYIVEKRMNSAKNALRRKNLALATIEQLRDQAYKIQEMLHTIDHARDQVAMVRAMEASTKVLQDLNAETGGVEHVSDVVDALGNQITNVEEISNVLNEPGMNSIDETEIDDEFELLMKDVNIKEQKREEDAEAQQTAHRMEELDQWEKKQRDNQNAESSGKDSVDEAVGQQIKNLELA